MKLQPFDSIYFWRKSNFEDHGTQHYWVFLFIYSYLKKDGNNDYITAGILKGLSYESIVHPVAHDNILAPTINYIDSICDSNLMEVV